MANSISVNSLNSFMQSGLTYWAGQSSGFLSDLRNTIAQTVTYDPVDVNNDLPSTSFENWLLSELTSKPVVVGGTFVSPGTNPGSLSLSALNTTLNTVTIPNYDITSPVISLPAKPELSTPVAPVAPTLEELTLPVSPTLELPSAPTLSNVLFPDAPTLELPTFAEAAPDAPTSYLYTNSFEWSEEGLPTPLLDAIKSKLLTDVNDGGYGIESTDETALWSRARDRELKQLSGVETEVEEMYANRGYSMPPGAMLNAFARARTEAEDRLSELERDISIKRADLFRDNRQFSIQQGQSVENIYLQHYGFRMERLLNAQRFAAEYTINIHDAYIRQFNAELQRYVSLADVYRTRLQAALTQIQIYEAEVRAAIARLEANRIDVELYQALLQAATTRINLFEAQLRATSLSAEIQRLRIESFRSQVQAFQGQIQANTSLLDAYRTEIGAEEAKVDIFRTEVGAYTDRVRAAAIEQDISVAKVRNNIALRESQIEEYKAQVAKYGVDVEIETQRVKSILDKYNTEATLYKAAISGYEALARVDLTESEAQIAALQEQTKRLQENARLTMEATNNTLRLRADASTAGAQLTAGVISGYATGASGLAIETQSSSG